MKVDTNFRGALVGLLAAALRKDVEEAMDCAAFVAKRLAEQGEKDCSAQLREMLGASDFVDGAWTPQRWGDTSSYREEGAALFRYFGSKRSGEPADTLDPPSILTPEQRATIDEILRVARVRLRKMEPVPTCILVYGTAIQEHFDLARYIAGQLRLEFFAVEPTDVVELRTGRWSGQLHKLRKFAATGPRVVALPKLEKICNPTFVERSWRIEELKCIRDRFLKDLSRLGTPTVVVACTNLEMNLAAEDWDRFGYRIELNAPKPDPWLLASRTLAKVDVDDGFEGLEKALDSLPAEVLKKPFPRRSTQD